MECIVLCRSPHRVYSGVLIGVEYLVGNSNWITCWLAKSL